MSVVMSNDESVAAQPSHFVPVPSAARLDELLAADAATIFLHDPFCPISADAAAEMAMVGGDVHLVDVSSQHGLSRQVERATGIRHESPQAIVIRGGQPAWHASHDRITVESVRRAQVNG
jgi:bacillithiol system protein YtxJ